MINHFIYHSKMIKINHSDSDVKVLCCGDPHFQPNNTVETSLLSQRFIEQALIHKPDFIVVLGDLIHTHERGHIPSMNNAYDFLDKLRKIAPTYCLIGNHDILHNKCFLTRIHGFNPLKEWKNITIIDKPEIHIIKGHSFVFCPYTEPGKLLDALALIDVSLDQKSSVAVVDSKINTEELAKIKEHNLHKVSTSTALFCHQEFRDVPVGIVKSVHGDVWPEKYPVAISGHIHDHIQLAHNIIYVGTPAQYNFGENAKKTISLFSFDTNKKFNELRIDLKIPRKITIEIGYSEFNNFMIPNNGDKIRLIVSGTSVQLRELDKSQKMKEILKAGIRVCKNPIADEKLDESVAKLYSVGKRRTFIETFNDVCKVNGLDDLFGEIFGTTQNFNLEQASLSGVNNNNKIQIKLNIK